MCTCMQVVIIIIYVGAKTLYYSRLGKQKEREGKIDTHLYIFQHNNNIIIHVLLFQSVGGALNC